jgi:hypothetical protein
MNKKTLLIAALALFTSATFAQRGTKWLGGTISSRSTNSDDDKETSFTFAPEFGYYVSDRWAIGGMLAFSNSTEIVKSENTDTETHATVFTPFARYTFAKVRKFDFFVNGGLSFGSSKTEDNYYDDEYSSHFFILGIHPGISYNISNKFAAQIHFPSLIHYYSGTTEFDSDSYDFDQSYIGFNDGYTIQSYFLDAGFAFIYKF